MNLFRKWLKSLGFACAGLVVAFRSELNLKIHVSIAILVVLFGVILNISTTEWFIVLLCFAVVISAELVNTAIENLVDLVSPKIDPLAGKVKDLAAGAVLVVAIVAAIIGLIIFVPKVWSLLF